LSDRRASAATRFERTRGLHLFALCAFAIAQPLFDLLGRHAEFFVSHGTSALEILLLVGGLLAVPPLCLVAVLWLVRRVSAQVERGLGLVFVAALLGTSVLPPLLRTAGLPDLAAVALALCAGIGGAALYARVKAARDLASVLALAPAVFAALFLLATDVRKLVFSTGAVAASGALVRGNVPIVLVIFDELPLSSLQDADGSIDSIRYPAFAAFARGSTWFRGVSAVTARTNIAVPAILTGRYPPLERRLPIRADFPENIFSLLDGAYELEVIETETLLHARAGGEAAGDAGEGAGLLPDLSLIYLHLVLPRALRDELPSVSETWGRFWKPRGEPTGDSVGARDRDRALRAGEEIAKRRQRKRNRARLDVAQFDRFVDSITPLPGRDRRVFYFLHVTLPHGHWRLLEDGRIYQPDRKYGFVDGRWLDDPWWGIDAYRRHLLQLAYTDRLLAQLIAKLEATNVYEPALIILTSDHGGGFWPGESFRKPLKVEHAEDLLSVPLFVKRPHQTEGVITDRFAESIDILPTIADVAGVEVPWELDGCSLFQASCAAREQRSLVVERLFRKLEVARYDPGILQRDDTLRRKVALFGSGERERGLYLAGRGEGLVGRRVSDLPLRSATGGGVRLDPIVRKILAGEFPGLVPARIVGLLDLAEPSEVVPRVALAVRGVIEAVVPAPHDGKHGLRVAAMLPPDAHPPSLEALKLYLLAGDPSEPTLAPLDLR
jgi:hypothetical protein